MELISISRFLLWVVLLAPMSMLFIFAFISLFALAPSERFMKIVFSTLVSACVFSAWCLLILILMGDEAVVLQLGGASLFKVDVPGSLFLASATFIVAIVGNFSATYLHRDPGFQRYFFAYAMFFSGICQVFAAAHSAMFVAGWEFVGVSSTLLIAYFQERAEPVKNSLLAFGYYRIGDVGLLSGMALFYYFNASHLVPWFASDIPTITSPIIIAFIGLAIGAAVKMSLLPFATWLPRAMEGPTPSSAVYYGALSVHAGAFLLWRLGPQLIGIPVVKEILIIVGFFSAFFAAWCSRVRPDVKTQLAYASMAQLGVICVEIGFGWQNLALWHILGHMCLRTLQFLSAPSTLHTFHALKIVRASADEGFHFEKVLPDSLRSLLYRFGIAEFHLQDFLTSIIIQPFNFVADTILKFDLKILAILRCFLNCQPRKINDSASSGEL